MEGLGAHNGGKPAENGHDTLATTPGVTLAESLRQKLEGAIAAGHLEPGSRLDEQEIAERFGVSRTPVRDAFRLMAAHNLIELRGRRDAFIELACMMNQYRIRIESRGLDQRR